MRSFDEIFQISAERHGGAEALEVKLSKPKTAAELEAIPEDRWLAEMSKYIFATGLNWTVIEKKWPGFEEAFHGFDLGRCAFMDDGMFDSLLQDTRIVRHGAKIQSVRDNAAFLLELRDEGGVGKVLGGWPSDAFADLLEMLKKRGSRLGGMTGAYSMRMLGRDSYILSKDVVARLIAEGIVDKAPGSKSSMKAVQAAFNTWMAQSGRSLTEISRVLALSMG
ncbi:MAG: DNA-3-methyladenine glycosylase I [Pseudomonadota bacterium]